MRRATVLALLLVSCTSSRVQTKWVEFRYDGGWVPWGAIHGTITAGGIVHAKAYPPHLHSKEIEFERQMRPNEIGRLQQAIETHLATFGPSTRTPGSFSDASELDVMVYDANGPIAALHLVDPCFHSTQDELTLWNEVMRAIRTPDYETLDHAFQCEK